MRRKQQLRLVVTFDTTTAALKTEQAAKAADIAGRLIPVPRALSAGCGLAWSAPLEVRAALTALVEEQEIACAGWHELLL